MNASEHIDTHIAELADWRGKMIAHLRTLIHEADPEIVEEWKWDVPVFVHNKMVCALGAFADHIKINFFQGASLSDPHKLFNSGLEAKKTRAIDLFEGDIINESGVKELIQEAVGFNIGGKK